MVTKYYKLLLTALAIGIFPLATQAIINPLPLPDVFISSKNLQQADTLLVVVKNETAGISGELGTVTLRFFRAENGVDWVAIVGMPVNKKPGKYVLSISVQGKQIFKKAITVAKRKFPVTALTITPDLAQQGYTVKNIITPAQTQDAQLFHKTLQVFNPAVYAKKPFIYPLSEISITGGYGHIRAAKGYKIQHLGADLKAPVGTPVQAVNDGTVVFARNLQNYGNTLIVDHGLGVYSLYLHLFEFKVAEGQTVAQSDTIALSGATGYATGPHLHFSIKIRNASVDPLKFIEATQAEPK